MSFDPYHPPIQPQQPALQPAAKPAIIDLSKVGSQAKQLGANLARSLSLSKLLRKR